MPLSSDTNGEPAQPPSKSHSVPIEYLDYKYIEKCDKVKELEKIYRVLISGVEGKYPDLEKFTFDKIQKLSPNSRVLRKDAPILTKNSMPKSEQNNLDHEIEDFLKSIPDVEKKLVNNQSTVEARKENHEFIPPVRSVNQKFLIGSKKEEKTNTSQNNENKSKKSPKPKDYSEWSKIEKELEEALEDKDKNKLNESVKITNDRTLIHEPNNLVKELASNIDHSNLDEESKQIKAEREKVKGNEAFGSGSYDEAIIYYTRSIQLMPNAAAFNNRALTYLKLEKWDKTIDDCNQVLRLERDNLKALLRRGTAYFKKKVYNLAREDMEKCLSIDPNDKKAKEQLAEIDKKDEMDRKEREKVKSMGGNRVQIEDTDGSENEEDYEEKPIKIDMAETTSQTITPVNIAQVESDDDSDQSDESPKSPVKFQLDPKLVEKTDKANQVYKNGQYGEAITHYTNLINELAEISKSEKEVKSHLGVLLNNRASCYQHICDYKSCIEDCEKGLGVLSELADGSSRELGLKLRHKRAHSLEMLEKYSESLLEYERIMQVDTRFKNAQEGYNRVRRMLIETGKLELPKSNQQLYEENKSKGNEYVKLQDFNKALSFYTECIRLDASQPTAYLNRSLCYLKLDNPSAAMEDSSFVLTKDPSNVKALYRRALANKMLGRLTESIADLEKLLTIEPNNQMARDEMTKIREEEKPKPTPKPKPAIKFEPVKINKTYDFTSITNGYEFLQAWNSVTPGDVDNYARLLENVEPANLPKFIGSKLDDTMFGMIIRALVKLNQDKQCGLAYLKSLANVQRFGIIKMFANQETRDLIAQILRSPLTDESQSVLKTYGI